MICLKAELKISQNIWLNEECSQNTASLNSLDITSGKTDLCYIITEHFHNIFLTTIISNICYVAFADICKEKMLKKSTVMMYSQGSSPHLSLSTKRVHTCPDVRSHTLNVRSSAQVTKCVSPRKNITCRIPEVWPEKTVGSARNQYNIKGTREALLKSTWL